MMLKAIDLINSGLRVNLGADWLQDILATMRYLVLPVVGAAVPAAGRHRDARPVAAGSVARGLGQRAGLDPGVGVRRPRPPGCC